MQLHGEIEHLVKNFIVSKQANAQKVQTSFREKLQQKNNQLQKKQAIFKSMRHDHNNDQKKYHQALHQYKKARHDYQK